MALSVNAALVDDGPEYGRAARRVPLPFLSGPIETTAGAERGERVDDDHLPSFVFPGGGSQNHQPPQIGPGLKLSLIWPRDLER